MKDFNEAEQFKSYWVESKKFPGKLVVANLGRAWQLQGSRKVLNSDQMGQLFILKGEV